MLIYMAYELFENKRDGVIKVAVKTGLAYRDTYLLTQQKPNEINSFGFFWKLFIILIP